MVPEQEHLTGYIPTVMGPVEFREWKSQLERINGILAQGGVEETFQRLSSQALRCNVARTLTGESFRDFGCRLPESMPLQSVCKLDRIDTVRIPGKSAARFWARRRAPWKTLARRRWR